MSRGSFLVNRPSRMERRKTRGGFAARSEPSKAATTAKAASGSFSRPESFSVPGKASHSSAMSRQSITRRHQRSLTSTEDAQRQWMMQEKQRERRKKEEKETASPDATKLRKRMDINSERV
ncbi:hypothetical protein RB195_015673 [Necator americanus]|uniref:Uncharacterized protein n=1 Tax=Necator americanus TaxID=51031 RepID=A0ABR1E8B4_NECAM